MDQQNVIYDARELGMPRMMILGVQHLFAMFGATVLVPLLTGLDVSITLLFAGIGTLMFHFISKWNVPAFLGSSFAFLGGYASVKEMGVAQGLSETLALDYACLGVACAGLLYFVMAGLIKSFGIQKILHFFPPVVTGPIVIAIGLVLSGSAIANCQTNWLLAIIAIVTVITSSVWGKGIIKIIPVLLGVVVSYIIAACMGEVDFSPLGEAAWVGFPIAKERTVLAVFEDANTTLMLSSILAIMPIAFATIMEHIGDMFAISSTVGKDFLNNPGLHRTLSGDGLATALASAFGAPANTTYGENTGVLNLTKVFDPRVIRIAACGSAHACSHHRRCQPDSLWHDFSSRCAQSGRRESRSEELPQCVCGSPHPGTCHWCEVWSQRQHRHWSHPPFRTCHRRPCRNLPQRHHAYQARHESQVIQRQREILR